MEEKAVFDIKVVPKSSRSLVTADEEGNIRIYLNSPPAEGRANRECIEVLSKKLGIAKSMITIEKGEKGRNKRIALHGLSIEDVLKKIRG